MLVRLSIERFLLIEGQELFFDRGLNVITGETGNRKVYDLFLPFCF
jgi:DNA repair protein RecN (Recombination protein N)